MSSKAKKGAKGKEPTKGEAVLQAVLLADAFQDRFRPLSIEKPRCLLNLANVPLIEYTLEFLAMNGVKQVFIYCGAHTDQVENYMRRSRWASAVAPSTHSKSSGAPPKTTGPNTTPFNDIQFLRLADARSTGDVLRDLDKRSCMDGDFILVHGDLVSNFMLDEALAAHKKRREESAANIMTLVLRSGGSASHRTKTNGITPVFVVDTQNKRCLQYDEMNPLESDHYITLDPSITDELSTDFEVRTDLIDAQVDICTPEVLALWSESFDYDLPRRNFLHGVLKDWELNGKMIFAEILDDGYAARASNLQMYESISRDVLSRWTFPLVPENNIFPRQAYTRFKRGLVLDVDVTQSRGTKITNSVIARGTVLGQGSSISNSIIGSGCTIGAGVKLENAYIWDDVTIDDGAQVIQSILADGVIVGKNSIVPAGSIISFNSTIGDNIELTKSVAVATLTADGQPISKEPTLLGQTTNAGLFIDPDDDDLDYEDPVRLQKSFLYSLAGFNISTSSISTLATDDSDDSDLDGDETGRSPSSSIRPRLSSFASDDSRAGAAASAFHADAVNGLVDALRATSGDFDSAKLEFMGLRLANDASDGMMRRAIATAFARRTVELLTPDHGGLDPAKAAKEALEARPGATRFLDEVGIAGGLSEQAEFILALQRALLKPSQTEPRAGTVLAALLQKLYLLDILEEDGILTWWSDERNAEGVEGMAGLKEKCRTLVEWLENAEEDDDDSDEDSD